MFDIAIIGCGIAGMSAAIYSARANKKVVIFAKDGFGGQIINSTEVANFPGFINITGFDFAQKVYNQILNLNVQIINEEVLEFVDKNTLKTSGGVYQFKTAIIANGLTKRKLGLYGEQDFVGKGISYCATCDGNFYKDKNVAVVGGGNTAIEDAIYLSNIVKSVYIIHRNEDFKADKILIDKLRNATNVKYFMKKNIIELRGNEHLESIILNDETEIKVDGLFIAIGSIPNNNRFTNLIDIDDKGYIISSDTRTNVDNIFVAGDTRTSELKQLITAASDGALAATKAVNHINSL